DLVLNRLGKTDQVVISQTFFREALADDIRMQPEFATSFNAICPIVISQGSVSQQSGDRRVPAVQVYGIDERFLQFHGVTSVQAPAGRDALISYALARDLGVEAGATILVRVQRPSDIPAESLHGLKDDLARAVRLNIRQVLSSEFPGEF